MPVFKFSPAGNLMNQRAVVWRSSYLAAVQRTDQSARVVVVEDAQCDGRQNARKVQEERRRYGLGQRVGADEPYTCTGVTSTHRQRY